MSNRNPGGSGPRRRDLVIGAAALAASGLVPGRSRATDITWRHGLSAFGDLALPPDFMHVPYVDPNAPKGGLYSHVSPSRGFNGSFLTFNSFNAWVQRGEGAAGMDLTFASLMARNGDEPDAMYGLAADSVAMAEDGLTCRFRIRETARFHDGSPLTAHDVAWSIETLKARGHLLIRSLMRDVEGASAEDDRIVTVRFAPRRGRDVPLFVASLPIFSRTWYATRDFEASTLEAPLGCGPYRVGRFDAGRFVEYERVRDWWGADLPIEKGQNNFDVVRVEYFRDRDVAFEGFSGRTYLFREEFTSRIWATRYDFPAIRDGRVKRETLPDETPSGAQGWFMNTRRRIFQDRRVREALTLAFDFEWVNRNIMYSSFQRTYSYFQNSDMEAKGPPSAAELALLEPFRGQVPDDVFGDPFVPPVSDGSGQDRSLLRRSAQLLQEAGWTVRDGRRVDAQGRPLAIEFLFEERAFEPHHQAFVRTLRVAGVEATLRLVDPVQYRARVDSFDFDLTVQRFNLGSTPGDGLRSYFSSESARQNGSNNLSGIADPIVDRLIDLAIGAKTREELTTACRALDRVLRAGRYWVPHWFKASHWIAYWDVFGRPERKPRFARGIPETWWWDAEKATRNERRG